MKGVGQLQLLLEQPAISISDISRDMSKLLRAPVPVSTGKPEQLSSHPLASPGFGASASDGVATVQVSKKTPQTSDSGVRGRQTETDQGRAQGVNV